MAAKGDLHVVVLVPAARGAAGPGAATPVYYRPMARWAMEEAAGLPRRSMGVSGSAGEAELGELLRELHGVRYYGPAEKPLEAARAAAAAHPGEGDVLVLDGTRVLLGRAALEGLLERHAAGSAGGTALTAPDGSPAGAWCWRRSGLDAAAETALEPAPLRDPVEALAVSDLDTLASAEHVLQLRLNAELLRRGVRLADPRTTRVDPTCRLAVGCEIEAGSVLVNCGVEAGARVEAHCRLRDAEIGAGSVVRQGSIVEGSRMGKGCGVGPYARLAGGTTLEEGAQVGSYAELERVTLGARSKVGGLSMIGNCKVGRDVEIGCGFLTCGSGAEAERATVIEDGAFIGAASQVVAAVTIGKGSFVATGTSVTDDAPADSFVISRGRQVVKAGYARRHSRRQP